jgi:CDP-glucose 4,6-dehydratase
VADARRGLTSGRYAGRVALVTGAQGFLGSWLAERLLEEGARVVVPRRDVPALSRFRLEGLEDRCDVVQADLLDLEALGRVVNEYEPELVFHLAAQTLVGIANRSPLATWETNVRGTWTVLEACRALGDRGPVRAIVVASSDKAYGAHAELPYREDFALQPVFPYDVSKACTDLVARSYATTYGLPVAVTRLANIYGPGDFNLSRVVPDSAAALARGERPVIRSDGSPQRDFIHVSDAVAAYLAVADSLARRELHGRAWNAGAGEPIAVLELVRRLIAASGLNIEPDVRGSGRPAGEIDRQWLDSTAIREELGWVPERDLDEGLAETVAWYQQVLA